MRSAAFFIVKSNRSGQVDRVSWLATYVGVRPRIFALCLEADVGNDGRRDSSIETTIRASIDRAIVRAAEIHLYPRRLRKRKSLARCDRLSFAGSDFFPLVTRILLHSPCGDLCSMDRSAPLVSRRTPNVKRNIKTKFLFFEKARRLRCIISHQFYMIPQGEREERDGERSSKM